MISVCLATYNGQRFIKRQMTSILSQIGEEDEVVVSDDGSTDDTLTILRDLNDSRIRIIDGAHRHSPTWNFEKALEKARGEYIFLSDQDDVWMPEKVSVTMKYLQQYDCVVSDNVIVDAEGSVIADSFYAINKTRPGKYYNLLIKNGYRFTHFYLLLIIQNVNLIIYPRIFSFYSKSIKKCENPKKLSCFT